jgi:acyl-CoA thioester hydrolase
LWFNSVVETVKERDHSEIQLRVRYAECDPMGLLHHAKYFEYLELSRTELLRASGESYRDLEARGVYFVVAKLEIRYKAPIRYDDVVTVHTRVERMTRTRVEHSYRMLVNGVLCTEASSTLACVDRDGKPTLMPENLWPAS